MTITTVDEGLIAYLQNYAALVALVSTRVYLMTIPQAATLPCMTVTRISTPRTLTHDSAGTSGLLAHPRFQFNAYATTYASAKAITDVLRAALNGKTGSIGYQTETATVLGTIANPGNASVVVTCTGMTGSAITTAVAVLAADTATIVAGKIRTALGTVANITSFLTVGGTGATVTLTRVSPGASITDFNISVANGTCSGLTSAPTSTETYNAINIQAALVSDEVPTLDPETGLYDVRSDYIIWHEE
jgi:hypothetical protein